MTKISWIVTLAPLIQALATTVKAYFSGESLTPEEIDLIKWLIGAFLGSGAIGAYLSKIKTVKTP